ncbi:ABC transporter ATP-binding protein [Dyadobacter sandarakinus]|uniref:ABC transporter ATP-binding protein n=2 Tax=Dyadobacter sandarakinus TaxID=2747268 RepID=A0ABX7IGT0_9BACT|nr:ABC transporter ATP-binding protein [Dyadobacter sandarakinus]
MIVADNVSKHFGLMAAVENVSFEVKAGEIMVLLGTSGCGKTTTLKMLNRLIDATSGTITIDGRDIRTRNREELRRSIGYVSQHHGLFPHYTVAENIGIVPGLAGWNKAETARKTGHWLEQLRLPSDMYGSKYPDELSGGQKQRVALARALVAEPPLLLMDEPFGALDPVTRIAVRNEFLAIQQVKSKTIVLVTHDIQEAFALGNTICLMHEGRIVQAGSAHDLMFDPANAFVANFFDHQRYMLELSALSLRDIWQQLPPGEGSTTSKLSIASSLWDALDVLSGRESAAVQVADPAGKDVRGLTFSHILEAYSRIKNEY